MSKSNFTKIVKDPGHVLKVALLQLLDFLAPIIPDSLFLRLKYRLRIGVWPNLRNPQTFNEKLQWLKLHDRKDIYTTMVDKAKAKEYVANIIGKGYIVPTLGLWDRPEEIDFDSLPDQFVLKVTHDSGGIVICRNKGALNKDEAILKLSKALKNNYFYQNREWPYKNVDRQIIAEKYLGDNIQQKLTDYKFYCFNGEPKFLYISHGMEDHRTASISFVSLDWKAMPFQRDDYRQFEELPPKPENFDDMIEIATKLCKNIDFLRVDMYNLSGKIFFSELTFSPCSGMMPFKPKEWDKKVGDLLKISYKK